MKYAEVLLNLPYEASYSYMIPDELEADAVFGVRVSVPFGRRKMTGFIVAVTEARPDGDYALKAIERVIDKAPVFNEILLDIARWMRTFSSSAGSDLTSAAEATHSNSHASGRYCSSLFHCGAAMNVP